MTYRSRATSVVGWTRKMAWNLDTSPIQIASCWKIYHHSQSLVHQKEPERRRNREEMWPDVARRTEPFLQLQHKDREIVGLVIPCCLRQVYLQVLPRCPLSSKMFGFPAYAYARCMTQAPLPSVCVFNSCSLPLQLSKNKKKHLHVLESCDIPIP